MQRHRIDQRLQVVLAVAHGNGQQVRGVTGQAVGLVVEHVPAPVAHVGQVDHAGHQPFQAAALAEAATRTGNPMCMQHLQQRRYRGRFDGEMEVDFRTALAFIQAVQRTALRQRHA
ncbi:hypothetical protein G6F23_015088 [Rhizopus arrhizus]|nr:hypothetical protein G6F23_015088 [Rhizopus arrhizus]